MTHRPRNAVLGLLPGVDAYLGVGREARDLHGHRVRMPWYVVRQDQGDPAVDPGNFIGHVAEHSLRLLGDPDRLRAVEEVVEERFVELEGDQVRSAVQAYAALTLVRLVYIATQLPERRDFVEALLDLCEERLARLGAARTGAILR